MTRCKFKCEEVKQNVGGYEYSFLPVSSGSEENDSFFHYTPFGSLQFGVTEERKFEVGKEYYLDITLAPEAT